MSEGSYKSKHTYQDRQRESKNIMEKFPDRVPVVVENGKQLEYKLEKTKYLVPKTYTIGELMATIRKRQRIPQETAIFLLFNNRMMPNSSLISYIYDKYKDSDGFLYAVCTQENVFG